MIPMKQRRRITRMHQLQAQHQLKYAHFAYQILKKW